MKKLCAIVSVLLSLSLLLCACNVDPTADPTKEGTTTIVRSDSVGESETADNLGLPTLPEIIVEEIERALVLERECGILAEHSVFDAGAHIYHTRGEGAEVRLTHVELASFESGSEGVARYARLENISECALVYLDKLGLLAVLYAYEDGVERVDLVGACAVEAEALT